MLSSLLQSDQDQEAAVMEEPAAMEKPPAMEEPVAVEEPAAMVEPPAMEEPAAVEEPLAVEETAAMEEPPAMEEPAAVEKEESRVGGVEGEGLMVPSTEDQPQNDTQVHVTCVQWIHTYIRVPPEAANFSLKVTALGKLCCVALSFCCVVLPCLVFLCISWMIKVMYNMHLTLDLTCRTSHVSVL